MAIVVDLRNYGNPHFLTEPFPGPNQAPYLDADGDRVATLNDILQVITDLRSGLGLSAPQVEASLANDTAIGGTINNDTLTSDASIRGRIITGLHDGARVLAEVRPRVFAKFDLDAQGNFTLDPSFARNGSDDGTHTIRFFAQVFGGKVHSVDATFTFDTLPPDAPPRPELTAESDSGVSNVDGVTNVTSPTFRIDGAGGAAVRLFVNDVESVSSSANGVVELSTTLLSDGPRQVYAVVEDLAGNISPPSGATAIVIDTVPPDPTSPRLTSTSDTGTSSNDGITRNTSPMAEGDAEVGARVTLFVDGVKLGDIAADGAWTSPLGTLSEGEHTLTTIATDVAGNASNPSAPVVVDVDTTGPRAIAGTADDAGAFAIVAFDEPVGESALDISQFGVAFDAGPQQGQPALISAVGFSGASGVRLDFASPLQGSSVYSLMVDDGISDLAGNTLLAQDPLRLLVAESFRLSEISPRHGDRHVNVDREAILRFTENVDPATITAESVQVFARGVAVPGRRVVSSTERFMWFFPDEPWSPSTAIRIEVNGSLIQSRDGSALDADLDGLAGGVGIFEFTTLSLTRIPSTNVFGYVRDSYTNEPIVGATIRVDALPQASAVTDANGRFELVAMPAPEFFVHVDGSTAVNAPPGFVYPNVGKPFHSVPGQTVQLNMQGVPFDVHLPPMSVGDIQPLSPTETTQVGFGLEGKAALRAMFAALDPAVWDALQVSFAPGAAIDKNGNSSTQAAIIPVPPDRLPAPLPPTANPLLVISIQAGSATNFDIPAPITFPNLENLAPGEKATIWSFNHDAGAFAPIGTGTVSPDGAVIVSDPGVGILAPGWHYTSPDRNWAGSGGKPSGNNGEDEELEPEVQVKLFVTGDTDEIKFTFKAPPGPKNDGHNPTALNAKPLTKRIEITIEGDFIGDFYEIYEGPRNGPRPESQKNLLHKPSGEKTPYTETLILEPGQDDVERTATLRSLQDILARRNNGRPFDHDVLYGAKITVKEWLVRGAGADEERRMIGHAIKVPYLYVDQSDDLGGEVLGPNMLKFADTIEPGQVTRTRNYLDLTIGAPPVALTFEGSAKDEYAATPSLLNLLRIGQIAFDPSQQGVRQAVMQAVTEINGSQIIGVKGVRVEGKGLAKNRVYLGSDNLKNTLEAIATGTANGVRYGNPALGDVVTANEIALFDSDAERTTIAATVVSRIISLFGDQAIDFDLASGSVDGVDVRWETFADSPGFISFGTSSTPGLTGSQPDDSGKIEIALNSASLRGRAANHFSLAQSMNRTREASVTIYVDSHLEAFDPEPREIDISQLITALVNTAAHEIAHTFGLIHTGIFDRVDGKWTNEVHSGGERARDDLMSQLGNVVVPRSFLPNISGASLPLALKTEWTAAQADSALQSLLIFAKNNGYTGQNASGDEPFPSLNFANESGLALGGIIDFGIVGLDQSGNGAASPKIVVENVTEAPVTIRSASVAQPEVEWSVRDVVSDAVIPPGEFIEIFIDFAAQVDERSIGYLRLETDDVEFPVYELRLEGAGRIRDPDLRFGFLGVNDLSSLNFGGATVKSSAGVTRALVVSNGGLEELVFTPTISMGEGDYVIAPDSRVEHRLPFGQSAIISIELRPTKFGLRPGIIQLNSNVPDRSFIELGAIGTGVPAGDIGQADFDWGSDFVAIEYSGIVERVKSNDSGDFVFGLPPDTAYRLWIFDPVSGLIAQSIGVSGLGGAYTDLTSALRFDASTAPDTDFDGLPDDIEFAIGTALNRGDTDGDGLSDFSEIDEGLDPLDGVAFPTGIVATLPLNGAANSVVIESQGLSEGLNAYVATDAGLAIVDVSRFHEPILLGALDIPGTGIDVAVDIGKGMAAVATGQGLQLVDISDPIRPALLASVNLAAGQVEIVDGIAMTSDADELVALDLVSREELSRLAIPSGRTLRGLAVHDGKIYATDSAGTLHIATLDGFDLTALSALNLPFAAGQIQVGSTIIAGEVKTIAYAAATETNQGGYVTVDVTNPTAPQLISGTDAPVESAPGTAIVVNGSGLGLLIGQSQRIVGDPSSVQVVNVRDLQNTYDLAQEFPLAEPPRAVAIGGGIGFVAGGVAGLHVVNYLPFDTLGRPPEIEIASNAIDLDPLAPGVQVQGASLVAVVPAIADDVQVRAVEFLRNGEVVARDVSFPWDAAIPLPPFSPDARTISLQVRATDTGGNATLSVPLILELTPDPTPPTITRISPVDGATVTGIRTVRISFSEPMDETTLTPDNIRLIATSGPDDPLAPVDVQLRNQGQALQLAYSTLPSGDYQLVIEAPAITDRSGNPLGNEVVTSSFSIAVPGTTIRWVNPDGGSWDDPANWEGNRLPEPSDDVLIDVPGNVTIVYSTGNSTIRSVISNNPFSITGGTLNVTQTVQVNNTFAINGGTLQGATVLAGSSGQGMEFSANVNNRLTGVTAQADLVLAGNGARARIEGGTTFTTARLMGSGSAIGFAHDSVLSGTILFEGPNTGGRSVTMNGAAGTLTIGPTGEIRTTTDFADQGTIGQVGGAFGGNMTLVNQGAISSQTSGAGINFNPANGFSNEGSLEVQNGGFMRTSGANIMRGNLNMVTLSGQGSVLQLTGMNMVNNLGLLVGPGTNLRLDGTWSSTGPMHVDGGALYLWGNFTTAGLNLPAFTRNDGTVNITGSLDNAGSTLTLNAATGSWNLAGGTINGGAVNLTEGTLLEIAPTITPAFSRLTAVNVNGSLRLSGNNSRVNIESGATFSTARLIGNGSSISFTPGSVLTGEILFEGAGTSNRNVTMHGPPGTLTIGPTGQIRTTADFAGTATIGGSTLVNQGTISSQTSGRTLTVNPSSLTNQGTLEAKNGGALNITNVQTNTGALHAGTGSRIVITGALTQSSDATIQMDVAGVATSEFGRVITSGQANLDGTLNVQFADGFEPAVGATFSILTYASLMGQFEAITHNLPAGLTLLANYGASSLTLTVASALQAIKAPSEAAKELSPDELYAITFAAVELWRRQVTTPENQQLLTSLHFQVAVSGGQVVGASAGRQVTIDFNAAGNGWFVDRTPMENEEFARSVTQGLLTAREGAVSEERIDLLTVLLHEIGHTLGLLHEVEVNKLMAATLAPGQRRLPTDDSVHAVFVVPGTASSSSSELGAIPRTLREYRYRGQQTIDLNLHRSVSPLAGLDKRKEASISPATFGHISSSNLPASKFGCGIGNEDVECNLLGKGFFGHSLSAENVDAIFGCLRVAESILFPEGQRGNFVKVNF